MCVGADAGPANEMESNNNKYVIQESGLSATYVSLISSGRSGGPVPR